MKKRSFFLFVIFTSTTTLANLNVNNNYIFYSDGGDTLQFSINNNKLYLIDGVELNYQTSKKIFYLKKIVNPDAYTNGESYTLYKKEYIISPVYKSGNLKSIHLTVKTYFGRNRLINSYTKKFNRINKNKGKFILKYELIKEYKDLRKYWGADFNKKLISGAINNEEEGYYVEPMDNFECIHNNDGTITIDPDVYTYYISSRNGNSFSGKSEFSACIHDYSYTNIEGINANTINFFQYSSGGENSISCGKYKLVSKRKIKPILFNDILSGKISENAAYTADVK